jgi:NAD(P)H dehydrogenase (quinone)
MYAITGITGKVGGAVARSLMKAGLPVRAVVRDIAKGKPWAELGCKIALAEIGNSEALAKAFEGMEGVFLMTPPNYDPGPGFPETQANAAAVKKALETARPKRVVFLSTVGAHVTEPNLLNNSRMTEEMLCTLDVPVCMLRAAWFMENAAWNVDAARTGAIHCFLQPQDHPIPMVATDDIGRNAAKILCEEWTGVRIVELEGPARYCANDIASGFSTALGHPVRIVPVSRDTWATLFRSQGMQYPMPRIRMLDGFNEGWIDFQGGAGIEHRKGQTPLDDVLNMLVA